MNVSYEHSSLGGKIAIPDNKLFRYNDNGLPSVPSNPTGLTGSVNATYMRIDLTWNDNSNETGYEVYRSTTSGSGYQIIGSTGQNVTSFSDTQLDPLTDYYYVVKAKNQGGVSGPSNELHKVSPNTPPVPAAPTNLVLTVNTNNLSMDLVWTDNSNNETGFEIERSVGNNTTFVRIYIAGEGETSYSDLDLSPSTRYFYRVNAVNPGGKSASTNTVNDKSPKSKSFINITTYGQNRETSENWNNFDSQNEAQVGTVLNNIMDNYSQNTGISMSTIQNFSGWSASGVTSGAVFPSATMVRYFFASGSGVGKFQVSGLDPASPYNFYFMASKDAASGNYNTKFTISSSETTINALGNATQLAELSNIIPNSSGQVVIEVSAATGGQGVINAMIIEKGDPADLNTFYASANQDISDPGNWGILEDGSGGGLSNFSQDNVTYNIMGNGNIANNMVVSGTNSKVIVAQNATISVGNSVNNLKFYGLELQDGVNFIMSNVADTFNLKVSGSELLMGTNSILDIGGNTLTLGPNSALNTDNNNGAVAIDNGNIILDNGSAVANNLYLQSGRDSINYMHVGLATAGTLNFQSPCNLTGSIKIAGGDVNSNSNLVLVSSSHYDANVEKIETGSHLNGDVTFQRYWSRPTNYYGFFLLGTPMTGQTIGDWADDFWIQGIDGHYPTAWQNVMLYDESTAAWVGMGNSSDAVLPGTGLSTFLFPRDFSDAFVRFQNTGPITQGAFQFDLTYSSGSPDPGWNMVANPYPSAIDWSKVRWDVASQDSINNVGSALYIWDQENFGYRVWTQVDPPGVSSLIATGQGFFIHTNNDNGQPIRLIVTENIKANEKPTFYRTASPENVFEVTLTDKDGHMDKTTIAQRDDATSGFDPFLDAYKRNGDYVNISSIIDENEKLAVNALPVSPQLLIPLNIEVIGPGDYTLMLTGLGSFSGHQKFYLQDHYLNKTVAMKEGVTYPFAVTDDPETSGKRFIISAIPAVKVKVDPMEVSEGTTVRIPVKVEAFQDIISAKFSINWDNNVLKFVKIGDFGIDGLSDQFFSITQNPGGTTTITMDYHSDTPVSLMDDDTLYCTTFEILPSQQENITPEFDSTDDGANFVNASNLVLNYDFTPGLISLKKLFALNGKVSSVYGNPIDKVDLHLTGDEHKDLQSKSDGTFNLELIEGGNYGLMAQKHESLNNRYVNVADLVRLWQHLDGKKPFDNPVQYMVSDLDQSGSIDNHDLELMIRLILNRWQKYNFDWVLIPPQFKFDLSNTNNFKSDLKYQFVADKNGLSSINYTGYVPGDISSVNGSGNRLDNNQKVELNLGAGIVGTNEVIEVPVSMETMQKINGMQLTFSWSNNLLEFLGYESDYKSYSMVNKSSDSQGNLFVLFENSDGGSLNLAGSQDLMKLKFKVLAPEGSEGSVSLLEDEHQSFAVNENLESVGVSMNPGKIFVEKNSDIKYLGCYPNPVKNEATLKFYLNDKAEVHFLIYNTNGQLVSSYQKQFDKGYQNWTWLAEAENSSLSQGLYFIAIQTDHYRVVDKIIKQ